MIRVPYFKNLLIDWLMIDLITFIWVNDIEMKFVIYLMQKFFWNIKSSSIKKSP